MVDHVIARRTPTVPASVVPGATHLFEEPGASPAVADLACGWFVGHFAPHVHHVG